MKLKHTSLLLLCSATLALSSCATTSISNTGRNSLYSGELAETDLLGIPTGKNVSDATIQATLARASRTPMRLRGGDHVMLIQSGALQPDPALTQAFSSRVRVSAFSGLPAAEKKPSPSALRLAAAQAGANKIVCVWGLLESAEHSTGMGAVTWLPVVGDFIPGRRTLSRITLKGMIMDTASGAWHSHSTTPVNASRLTAAIIEDTQSARQTDQMKADAYEQLARMMAP
jgi:hypothetical protein